MRFDDRDVDSGIPAGYTYLGQFVFHDISRLKTDPSAQHAPRNLRSAALDLDSLFGVGDAGDTSDRQACPMALGRTTPSGLPLDLPRTHEGRPLVPDPRSDDLLPLAQMHMAVIRFHNAILATVGDAAKARRMCLLHFQSIVLHDYLPRVIDPGVCEDVCRHGRAVIWTAEERRAGRPFLLPLEFAAAAGRFGHSMVRSGYRDWNHRNAFVRVDGFWHHTYNSSDWPRPCLSDEWTTDWNRIFPTRRSGAVLMGSCIGTRLASPLGRMPAEVNPHADNDGCEPSPNLAVRTLERGWRLSLASGQEVFAQVSQRLRARSRPPMHEMTEDELLAGETPACVRVMTRRPDGQPRLLDHTPLWFYLLKEAEIVAGGRSLGPLGSRIVMETLHAAIDAARPSILDEGDGWRCDSRLEPQEERRYAFADLLEFSGLLD
jgi:hypothetical protein